jgi:hypothetical protein
MKWMSFAALILCAFAGAEAQTINAASCSASDVQTAFNAVTNSTTTVNIPACNGVGWATQVTLIIPAGSVSLSVLGAGNLTAMGGGDKTVILDNYASNNPILNITTGSGSTLFRLAGITFQGGTGSVKWGGIVNFQGNSANIRVDHTHFNTITYSPAQASSGVQFTNCTYGVVDHSIFDNPAGTTNNMVRAYNQGACYGDSLGLGDQAWAHSTGLGSANFLFVENNTFNSGFGNDCTNGGSFVWRFNQMNMTSASAVQTHPTGGAGRIRGCRAWEVYENQFDALSGNYLNATFFLSSGTGVIWGNTIPSSPAGGGTGYGSFISLHSMRRSNSTYAQTATPNGWGYCGTSQSGTSSNWDQNVTPASGYHCMDQPGEGVGDLLIGGFSSDGSGANNVKNTATGCTSTSACAWVNQVVEPVYEWMDTYSTVPNNPSNLLSVYVTDTGAFVANSDYYLWCNPGSLSGCNNFTGTAGVGSGPLASRPATCTTGVAYWATDQGNWNQSGSGVQGELFKCTATNTWTLFYTPYIYPHPLDTTSATPNPPTAPQGSVVPE